MQQLHATITLNNYMQQLHATITSNNYMQQLQATITCNNYMQQLHVSYKQKLHAKITCKQLHATVTSKNYLHALCTCTLRITISFFMSQRLLGGLLIFFFTGETQVNVHLS